VETITAVAPTRVLLAIASPALLRVIEHLLHELPGLETTRAMSPASVLPDAIRLAPDVIVLCHRTLGKDRPAGAALLRHASPASKLVFITDDCGWWPEVDAGRPEAADASLEEEELVSGLLPIVNILVAARAAGHP
jgi:hypothetical protein